MSKNKKEDGQAIKQEGGNIPNTVPEYRSVDILPWTEIDGEKRVFLQLRTCDAFKAGAYGSKCKDGEKRKQVALRVLHESLGLEVEKSRLMLVQKVDFPHEYANGDQALFFSKVYSLELTPEEAESIGGFVTSKCVSQKSGGISVITANNLKDAYILEGDIPFVERILQES